ncbi:23S rRNA (adenine(2503)-C(2))-methyltransferase RlmN [Candidatus Omnitrophota bacterium]
MNKKDIKNFTIEELKSEMKKASIPSYRAEQIFYWVYKKGVCDFNDMNNIPIRIRDTFYKHYYIGSIKLKERLESIDGTEKFLFELSDGNFIETVLIYADKRRTVCLSTQVGCKYACRFCASGLKGFVRNLYSSEIINQILSLQHAFGRQITNFVFMGMGEPLDNYENVSKSIVIMNSREALGIGARRITLSTCGIIPGIERFKRLGIQANLSISLHATNNKLRDFLMPINKIYPLEKLILSCERFIQQTGRKLTLEYVLIKGKNDSSDDAQKLLSIVKRLKAKVNLIPYSPVSNKNLETPLKRDIGLFKKVLLRNRIDVSVRRSKGRDIQAACGQLAIRENTRHFASRKRVPGKQSH